MVAVMRTGPGDEPESTDNDSDTGEQPCPAP